MVIFDIDDTLTIIGDRRKYLQQEPKEWDKFFMACGEDKPNWPIINLCRLIQSSGMPVVFMTGRTEESRAITIAWLAHYDCWKVESVLLMRKPGDERHDIYIKPEMAAPYMEHITMVFDDRNSVVKMWRELGLTCVQVAENDY